MLPELKEPLKTAFPILLPPEEPEYPELPDVLPITGEGLPFEFPIEAIQLDAGTFAFEDDMAGQVEPLEKFVKFQPTVPPAKLTVTVFVPTQPVEVPDTVYIVVTVGVAVTVAPVVALSPAEGDQV